MFKMLGVDRSQNTRQVGWGFINMSPIVTWEEGGKGATVTCRFYIYSVFAETHNEIED